MANKNKSSYQFRGKVTRCPGVGGWYSVALPYKYSEKIKKLYSKTRYGFIPITATLDKVSWGTSLMPKKDEPYFIALKAKVRKDTGVQIGNVIKISFVVM